MGDASELDAALMRMAIDCAREAVGLTGENPAVGCCLARGSIVLALARTGVGGRPHAEERALTLAGPLARGATAYVTLEPCAWRTSGATACAELLVRAGVARVVVAAGDPSQAGQGLERLRAAGARVEIGLLATSAEVLRAVMPPSESRGSRACERLRDGWTEPESRSSVHAGGGTSAP